MPVRRATPARPQRAPRPLSHAPWAAADPGPAAPRAHGAGPMSVGLLLGSLAAAAMYWVRSARHPPLRVSPGALCSPLGIDGR